MTVDESAAHRHGQNINGNGEDKWLDKYGTMVTLPTKSTGDIGGYACEYTGIWVSGAYRVNTDYTGNNMPHNTMQPSKAVYVWIRTA